MGIEMQRGDILTAYLASGHQVALAHQTNGNYRVTVLKDSQLVEDARTFESHEEERARNHARHLATEAYAATGETFTWTLDTTRRVNTALVELKQTTTQTTAAATSDPMDRIITAAAHGNGYIPRGGHHDLGEATSTQLIALKRRGLVGDLDRHTDRKRTIKGARLTAKAYRQAGVPAPQPTTTPAPPVTVCATAGSTPVAGDTEPEPAPTRTPAEPARGWTAYLHRLNQATTATLEPATHGHVHLAKVTTTPGARQHYDVNGLAHCGAGTGRTIPATRWRTDSQIHYVHTEICRRCAPALHRALTTAADHGDEYAASAITALEPADPRADAALIADIRAHLTAVHTPAPTPAQQADLTGYGQYAQHLRAQVLAGFAAGNYPPGFGPDDL